MVTGAIPSVSNVLMRGQIYIDPIQGLQITCKRSLCIAAHASCSSPRSNIANCSGGMCIATSVADICELSRSCQIQCSINYKHLRDVHKDLHFANAPGNMS